MARQSKITISFSREYQDVYEFLCGQVNVSGYVCKVIREGMSTGVIQKETVGRVSSSSMEPKVEDDLKKAIDGFDL